MIGVNTSIFKSAGRKLVNLLGTLKDRATYYENGTDSVAEKNRIDDLGILDKATILLTPTATSDARVHSVKTYTGDELVTNGGFDTDSDWSKVNSTISGGKGNLDGDGQTALLWQDILTDGKTYKATFTVSNYDGSGSARLVNNSVSITYYTITGDGTFTIYFRHSDASGNFLFYAKDGAVLSIDNVSVTEADADFDFDRASSATRINSSGLVQDMQSITDPELILNGDFEELGSEEITNGSFDTDSSWTLTQATISNGVASFATTDGSFAGVRQSVFTIGKTYLISLDVSDLVGTAEVNTNGGTSIGLDITTNGTKSFYMKAENTDIEIKRKFGVTNVSATIDNVSVKQVNVDSEGNDIWNLTSQGDSTSIITDKLTLTCDDGDNVSAAQSYSFTDGNTYKLSFDLTGDNQNKNITIRDNSGATGGLSENVSLNFTGTETKTFIFTANSNSNSIYTKRVSSGTYSWSIDNVSLKDITFSTDVDLARINYDSNGENGHILLEPTSTNLVTYSEDIDSLNDGDGEVAVNSTLTYESDVVAPDGSLGVYRIQNRATASTYLKVTNDTTAAQSMSVWVKAKTVGANNKFTLYRDGTGSEVSDVKTATGEWQRFEYSWSTVGSGAYFINNDGDTYTSDLYVWGIQVENLPYTTSYIPNHGTAVGVTRAAETLVDSGNTTLINTDQGVFYAEIARTSNNADFELISLLQDSDTSTKIAIGFYESNNNFFIRTYYNGSDVYPIYDAIAPNLNQFYKVAVKYNRNGINNVWIDGIKVVADVVKNVSAPSNPITHLKFDWNPASTQFPFHGKCKALAVFNEALSDTELENLTS